MTAPNQNVVKRNKTMLFFKKNISGWMIMLPTLILFAFFVWGPLVQAVQISMFKTRGYDMEKFVWFKNYYYILRSPDFLPALKNTFVYIGWSLVIGFLTPIIMATIINEMVHFKGLFRIGTYVPNIVPGLATIFMWRFFLRGDNMGIVNMITHLFGAQPVHWLATSSIIIPVIVVTLTWKGAGATSLIYLAGLQGVNPELYEAAAIDGAGIVSRAKYVTVPNLFNLGRTLLILQIIAVFQILYEPLVMTNGGPNDASISLMMLVFQYAFNFYYFQYASAVSVVMCLILVIITAAYNIFSKRLDIES